MHKEKGMGRTRLGRFAAITVPATIATAGIGVAILQGSIGAALASSDAFNLKSDSITSNSLKVRPGAASVGGGTESTIYAETGSGTSADGLDVTASVAIPVFSAFSGKNVQLTISSTDPTVSLPGVILNAKTLGVSDPGDGTAASLTDVDLGITQQAAGFTDTDTTDAGTGYTADGFALQSGDATLNKVDADAYAIHLDGLSLDNLSIGVGLVDAD